MTMTEIAAMQTPSQTALVAALARGESHAFVHRVDGDLADKSTLTETHEALRNKATTTANRAKAQTGGQYTVELGEQRTRSRDLLLFAVVTRVN